VLGEPKEKCHTEGPDVSATTMGSSSATTLGPQLNPGRTRNPPNFPQPFYQVHAYGPGNQRVSDAYYPRPPVVPLVARESYPGMLENVREQVDRMFREFGLEPKGRAKTYQKPHLDFLILYHTLGVSERPNSLDSPGKTLGLLTNTSTTSLHRLVTMG
jgi:hypothetical protein